MTPFEEIPATGGHAFLSLSARTRVPFTWMEPHSVDGVAGVTLTWVHGARFPVARSQTGPVQGFKINAVTRGDDTPRLLSLLEAGRPIGLLHATDVCEIEACDIPSHQIVYVTGYPRTREDTGDTQRTAWVLEATPADPSTVGEYAGTGWWDVGETYQGWNSVGTAGGWWDLGQVKPA